MLGKWFGEIHFGTDEAEAWIALNKEVFTVKMYEIKLTQKQVKYVYLYSEAFKPYIHKMNNSLLSAIILLICPFFASCVKNKDLTYLQYKGVVPDIVISVTPAKKSLVYHERRVHLK